MKIHDFKELANFWMHVGVWWIYPMWPSAPFAAKRAPLGSPCFFTPFLFWTLFTARGCASRGLVVIFFGWYAILRSQPHQGGLNATWMSAKPRTSNRNLALCVSVKRAPAKLHLAFLVRLEPRVRSNLGI